GKRASDALSQRTQQQTNGENLEEEARASLSPRQLAWRQLKKNRFAMVGGGILCILYLLAIFAEFLAPYPVNVQRRDLFLSPPRVPTFHDGQGRFTLIPHIPVLTAADGPPP